MRKLVLILATQILFVYCSAQFTLIGNYTQDFNSLLPSGTGNVLPGGWMISESGTAADGMYNAGTGSGSTGDTYSFGAAVVAERALGTLQSGTLQSVIGFYFTNATGSTITRLTIMYTGEQWRLGAAGRNDRLDFQFSLNASTLANGDWADMDVLDFTAPVSSGATGALDGNEAANKQLITSTITGILIAPGSTCFFRWTDPDVTGSDDGLAIDDLSIEPGFAAPSPLYYQTKASGNWSALSSWEVSTDQLNWTAATEIPTWYADVIRIRTGHLINHQYFATADQLIIETGSLLQHSGGRFTLFDGAGDDLQIESGGIFHLSVAGNTPLYSGLSPVIRNRSGGIIRISAGGLSTVAGAGVHAANFVYEDASVLENAYNGMGANGVTYFPHVNSTTVPVLRITQNISLPVGATAATRVNGVFEANGNISFTAAGQKIFRNGIRGTGSITTTPSCGLLLVDGVAAILGGSGPLNMAASAGLQIGSGTGTTVTLVSNKVISGNIALLPADTYIDLGNYQLQVSGTISGGGVNSYFRTGGTGALVLENITVSGKLFPVGHTRYNPVLIENGSGHHWSVRVSDGVVPDFPYTTDGAVLLTWHIQPSVNPPVSGAAITFQFDRLQQTGPLFNTVPYDNEPVQAWHRVNGFWLTAAVPLPLVNAGGDLRTVKVTGLTQFSAYGLSRLSLPLPVKLLSFQATPIPGKKTRLKWKITAPVTTTPIFIPERSPDGIRYTPIDTIQAERNRTEYIRDDEWTYPGSNYYRLRTDEPGSPAYYSQVIKLVNRESGIQLIQLNPNPVKENAFLLISADKQTRVNLVLMDMAGKQFTIRRLELDKGLQSVTIGLSGLPAGFYYLQVNGDSFTETLGFIKW